MIAYEVMYLHYNGLVGLIPLSETPHELVTNKYYQIPMSHVRGDYRKFIDLYSDYMTDELKEKFYMKENYTEMFLANNITRNNLLDTDYLYVEHDYNNDIDYDNLLISLDNIKKLTKNSMCGQIEQNIKKKEIPLFNIRKDEKGE